LAHTINPKRGHGDGFWSWFRWLQGGGEVSSCGKQVPSNYNPCH
jgi:hypothetical protein